MKSLPELTAEALVPHDDRALTARTIAGYRIDSWLKALGELGSVAYTEVLGEPAVVVAGAASNKLLWQAPEHWSYRDTDTGTFFCQQMGEDHVSALDGEPHRRLRKLILPAFGAAAMQRDVRTLESELSGSIENGAGCVVDLYGFLCRAFAQALTRTQVKSRPDDELLDSLCDFEEAFIFGQQLSLNDQQRWFGRERYQSLKRAAFAYFDQVLQQRRSGERQDDSLQLLLEREPPEGLAALSETELQEAVYLLSVAGVGNIANLLCPLVYEMQGTDWPDRLRAEIGDRPLSDPATLRSLKVASALQRETERLFAPAPIIPKRATVAMEVQGRRIAAGTLVMHLHTLWHYDPDHFEAPLEFRPERWLDGAADKPNAFGGGKHLCLGMGVTRAVLPMALALLYRHSDPVCPEPPHFAAIDPGFEPSPVSTVMANVYLGARQPER